MTYNLKLFLVLEKRKKKRERLINIKSIKKYVFYDLLIWDSSQEKTIH